MWKKRIGCIVSTCIIFVGMICMPVSAEEMDYFLLEPTLENRVEPFATNSFAMTIPVKSLAKASTGMSLEAGETVTIKGSYTPFSATLDVGLITPSGNFYGWSISGGTIDKTIQVDERGTYTLQIRNNSNYEVQVSGYVNY